MDIQTLEIVRKANRLANDLCTRDPHRIAQELGIEVIPLAFKKQRGAYKVLMRNRFIFIKDDLHPVMIIPGLFEPPVRTLRAAIPENKSHIFR